MRSPLGAPEPTPFSVRWDRTPDQVAMALDAAVRGRVYVDPGREPRPFYRLDGAVFGSTVSVRLTPYIIPGVIPGRGSIPIVVGGEIKPLQDGAALDGWISTGFPTLGRWLLLAGSVAWFVTIVLTGALMPWLVMGGLVAAVAAFVVPWNRRRVDRSRLELVHKVLTEIIEQQAR
jgi:hypothetical protein